MVGSFEFIIGSSTAGFTAGFRVLSRHVMSPDEGSCDCLSALIGHLTCKGTKVVADSYIKKAPFILKEADVLNSCMRISNQKMKYYSID